MIEIQANERPAVRAFTIPKRFSERQAAEFLGLRYQSLKNMRCNGRPVPAYYRIGGKIVYRLIDLQEWMKARRVDAVLQ
jgi:hypothetical protein